MFNAHIGSSEPLVTVVMPVFNGLAWLEDTIHSVTAQKGVRLECIAIDDGSTDGSGDLLRRYGWRVLTTDRLGPNVARAHGLDHATGDLIAFLDQDDIWHPDHLALATAALSSFPQAEAAVATRVIFSGRSRPRLGAPRRGAPTFDPWAVYPINIIDTPSMVVIWRRALDAVDGWPVDRSLGADPLLWWRLSAHAPLAVLPRRTVGMRQSGASLSLLSRARPLAYLRHLHTAAVDAISHRTVDEARELMANAHRIFNAITLIVTGIIDGDSIVIAAHELEIALDDASDEMVIVTVGFLGWLLAPQLLCSSASGQDSLTTILDTWPESARRTRAAVQRMVASVVGPWRTSLMAMRAPTPHRIGLAGAAWAFAAAARCGRVSDPLGLHFAPRPSIAS
jgi:glycosyltransferase involved in cell wall biosynthesis